MRFYRSVEKVPDAKNDDDGVYLILLGVILKQMVPYTRFSIKVLQPELCDLSYE